MQRLYKSQFVTENCEVKPSVSLQEIIFEIVLCNSDNNESETTADKLSNYHCINYDSNYSVKNIFSEQKKKITYFPCNDSKTGENNSNTDNKLD